MNEVAAQNGMCAFQFNTYIIAVLVIFYLQYNKKFPKLKELPASQTKFIHTLSDVSEVNVKQAIWEFFEFYGKKYEPSNQMISIQIGRWQDLQFLTRKAETMNLTPEQKRCAFLYCYFGIGSPLNLYLKLIQFDSILVGAMEF